MANDIETILKAKLAKAIRELPTVLGNTAVNYSLDAFKSQSWEDQAWRKRIYRKGQGPTILVASGRGRRSIRIFETSATRVTYGTDVPYMKYHNEGFSGPVTVNSYSRKKYTKEIVATNKNTKSGNVRNKTVSSASGSGIVKSHQRMMNLPKRQFIGITVALRARLIADGKKHILNQLRNS